MSTITRRQFLKQTTSTISALTIAESAALAVNTAPKKIRIGVVGGRFGCAFQWHEHPDCIVEAASDLREDRRKNLTKTYNPKKMYNSLAELVKDKDIDAVAVFTGAPDHAGHVVEVMEHGKHVICAVPACLTLEEAEMIADTKNRTGLTYMMAETSYYQQSTISARKFVKDDKFGELFYTESEYLHPGLEPLQLINVKRTWRYGYPPMLYPTHCTAHLVGVTGERLTEVCSHGWSLDHPFYKGRDNQYHNPFVAQSAMFKTDKNHAFRVNIFWHGAVRGCERAQWVGSKMSFYTAHPHGLGPVIVHASQEKETDDAGFVRTKIGLEKYEQVEWWKTDMLPEPLRHKSGHDGSHTFLTHEFIDALAHNRQPAINLTEALAYTVPGIIAHQSALDGGRLLNIPDLA
jgi:predicted dehydrogenase